MTEFELRQEVVRFGRLLWDRGHIGAIEGNLSVRISSGKILCTPAGTNKGFLQLDDLVVISDDGAVMQGGVPSSEIQLHLECYAQRPDCQAVIHAHPPFATAFALAQETIPDDLLPEAIIALGTVALVPFAMPGTTKMRDAIRPFLANHRTFLLANHGALTLGATLADAFALMDTLERVAAVIYRARELGTPVPLSVDVLTQLRSH